MPMKNRVLFIFFLICNIAISHAQEQSKGNFIIKGFFVDSLTNQGEPYATIKITKENFTDKALKMAVTNNDGGFQVAMTASLGNYLITISSIGKRTVVKNFRLVSGEQAVDLGKLYTSESTNELKGVEIVAQKPLVKVEVDKLSYNVEDDPESKANTVLEMLRKVPLVTVDGEDNIKVNGSSSFKIHVNGKPNTMISNNPKDVLKSMPASSIKNIEVITSPGAKYDAEGIGGILNIVTVDRKLQGYTATLNTSLDNNRWGNGVYAALQKGKFTVSVNYNHSLMDYPKQYSNSSRENLESDEEKYLDTSGLLTNKGRFQYGNLEASYEIDTLRLLSFGFGMYGGGSDDHSNQSVSMYGFDRQKIVYGYEGNNISDNTWYSFNGNVDYQKVSAKNKNRIFTLSYKVNANPSTNDMNNDYSGFTPLDKQQEIIKKFLLYNSRSEGSANTVEHTFQGDYATPFGKYHTLETGLKYILRRNTSDTKYYEADGVSDSYKYNEKRSSNYRHINNILAAYLGYSFQYKKISFKPGVRYERTAEKVSYIVGPGADFKTSYNDLVPSVMLGLKTAETQNIRFVYNMRIWRPNISNLNPYFDNSNPMAISQGNSSLKSEKSHKFEATYSNFTSVLNLNLSLTHSFGNDGIQKVSRLITQQGGEQMGEYFIPEGAMYSTFKNIGKSRNTGLNMYVNLTPTPKLRFSFDFYGSYSDIRSPQQGLHNYGWSANLYGSVQYTFPYDIRLSVNAGGATPYIELQGKGPKYFFYGFNMNRSFLKDKRLTVGFYCNNPFFDMLSLTSEVNGDNFISKSTTRFSNRRIGVNVSYRFGELKSGVKKAIRTIVNDDVKSGGGGASAIPQ